MGRKGLIIAIDGPAASGKSTTAKLVANHFGYLYVDTGAMYRALTLKALRDRIDPGDTESLSRLADHTRVDLRNSNQGLRVFLDGVDVTEDIRSPAVTRNVSAVSEVPHVREVMVRLQRELGRDGGVVLEGRDIGTVVFPEAKVKIFMEATVEERAKRRCRELKRSGIEASPEELGQEIRERDLWDSSRNHSPLRKAEDALVLDTTNLSIDEQVQIVIAKADQAHRLL